MNFGLPLVLSDKVGCHPDLVSRDLNGYVVSSTDPDAAAAALGRLVADAGLRHRMGAASRARIEEWYPMRTMEGILAAVRYAASSQGR